MEDNTSGNNEWDQDLLPSMDFEGFEYDELGNLFDAAFGMDAPSEHDTAQSTTGLSPAMNEISSPSYRPVAATSSTTNVRSAAPRRSSFSRRQLSERTASPHSSDRSQAGASESKNASSSSPRTARRGPSPDALERRRRQNRASQLAFRERSKKALEEMRMELQGVEERNKKLVVTLSELLQQANSLRGSIEQALVEYGGGGRMREDVSA